MYVRKYGREGWPTQPTYDTMLLLSFLLVPNFRWSNENVYVCITPLCLFLYGRNFRPNFWRTRPHKTSVASK